MIEKLPCHDEIVYEIQRAIQTFGPPTAQSLMKRRAQVTASNECEFSEVQNPVRSLVSMANCKRKETSKEGIEG